MEILDENLYNSGKALIEKLDNEGFVYPVILWIKIPEKEEWSLLFGIPGLNVIGSTDIHGNIRRIIRLNEINISPDNISLVDSMSALCINLKSAFKVGPGISKMRLSKTSINGFDFPESVIYRIV